MDCNKVHLHTIKFIDPELGKTIMCVDCGMVVLV